MDLCFPEHRLAMEFNEKGDTDRKKIRKDERQKPIKKELDCNLSKRLLKLEFEKNNSIK